MPGGDISGTCIRYKRRLLGDTGNTLLGNRDLSAAAEEKRNIVEDSL